MPVPDTTTTQLSINFGAGELTLNPGAQKLVEGTATYNVPDLKPEVVTESNGIRDQPRQADGYPLSGQHQEYLGFQAWHGEHRPGHQCRGLYRHLLNSAALADQSHRQGWRLKGKLSFSQANPSANDAVPLRNRRVECQNERTGERQLQHHDLQQRRRRLYPGFHRYLQRDATITISSGLSNIILVIPQNVNANVTTESGLANINAGPGWTSNGSQYTQSGSGPTLTFLIKTGAGNLTLTH